MSSKIEEEEVGFREQFEDPLFPELALDFKWTVWEQWSESGGKSHYAGAMQKVACFHDMITFWQVWNNLPHADPKNFFAFPAEDMAFKVPFYRIGGSFKRINSIAVFKAGIKPEWEDKANQHGGEYSLKVQAGPEVIGDIWSEIVLSAVSGEFPSANRLTGVRIVDKNQIYKIEIWTDFKNGAWTDQQVKIEEIIGKRVDWSRKVEFWPHDQ